METGLNKLAAVLGVVVFLGLAADPGGAQTLQAGAALPQVQGTTLDGENITLPDAARGKVALLIITFSKAAGEHARVWNDHFIQDYPQDDKATSYSIAMLEDVPSLLRGVVRSGIKRSVPPARRRRFVTVAKDEAQWKKYVGMKEEKDACLLLLDSDGLLRWTQQGVFDPAAYQALKARIAELVK